MRQPGSAGPVRRDAAGHREAADDLCFHSQCSTDPLLPRSLFSTLSLKFKIMIRFYFILVLAIGSNAVLNDDLAPAGGSSEDIDLARSRGYEYCDEADLDVTVCIDSLEAAKQALADLPASYTAAVKKQKEEEFFARPVLVERCQEQEVGHRRTAPTPASSQLARPRSPRIRLRPRGRNQQWIQRTTRSSSSESFQSPRMAGGTARPHPQG